MGISDAMNAAMTENDVQDTLHYFALKKKRHDDVKNVSYDEFVEMKKNGKFGDYNLLDDAHLSAVYTQ